MDVSGSDVGGPLPGKVTFGGLTAVQGGLGDDTFNVGSNNANSHVLFGDAVAFLGNGGDHDVLDINAADVQFLVTGNKNTCETLVGPMLP